ncbi:MAG: 50S ribosomal protein L18 [Patescibacteria group bacterium]
MMDRIKKQNQIRERRKNRNRAKVFGTQEKPRLSVFRSNKFIYAQLINDEKGHTMASAASKKAQEAGKILAEKAMKEGIEAAVFNRGSYKFHGRVKALAEEVKKGGIKL